MISHTTETKSIVELKMTICEVSLLIFIIVVVRPPPPLLLISGLIRKKLGNWTSKISNMLCTIF